MWGEEKAVFTHSPPNEEDMGVLALRIGRSGGRSIARSQYHARAFKIIRPHYLDDSGQVYYTLANPGGGYVGGDSYRISLELEPNSAVLFTDQSAAKVYRTPGDFVVQNVHFKLDRGSVLEYLPDQLILYRGADYRQHITVDMHPEASLFMSDIVTPGWSPTGELFLYDQAHLRTVVTMNGEPVLVDNIRINPTSELFDEVRTLLLGRHTHFSTVICLDPHISSDTIQQIRAIIDANSSGRGEVLASVSEADIPGFVLRGVADWTEDLMRINLEVASFIRAQFRKQGRLHLRKY